MIYIVLFLMFFIFLSITVLSNQENISTKDIPYIEDTNEEIKKKLRLILSDRSPKWKLVSVKRAYVMYREMRLFGCKRYITLSTNVSEETKNETIYLHFEDNDKWNSSYDLTLVDKECAHLLKEIIRKHINNHKKYVNEKL